MIERKSLRTFHLWLNEFKRIKPYARIIFFSENTMIKKWCFNHLNRHKMPLKLRAQRVLHLNENEMDSILSFPWKHLGKRIKNQRKTDHHDSTLSLCYEWYYIFRNANSIFSSRAGKTIIGFDAKFIALKLIRLFVVASQSISSVVGKANRLKIKITAIVHARFVINWWH